MGLPCCVLLLSVCIAASLAELHLETSRDPEGNVHLVLSAPVTGYLGVGFSINGRIESSDILIAWVDSDGQPHVVDAHGVEGRSSPVRDNLQNYKIVDSFQNLTHTVIKVSRPWDTCDRRGDIVFVNDTMRLIWTTSEYDPPSLGWGEMEWSGPRSILIAGSSTRPTASSVQHWDVLAQEFTLPGDSPSFHWCKIYKVPSLPRKHHIIGFSPRVEEGHASLVAKMVLYECLGGSQFEVFGSHPGSPCHDPLAPREWQACHTPVAVWATGGRGQFLPDHIGLPIAEGEGKSTYFMLEIHYDNPALQRVRDNSGLRLYYSPELRKFDSSILMTGITPTGIHIIPPKQSRFTSRGYCDSQCTNLMFPETGIKIVSVRFHTHSAGRQVRLRHIREGKELQVIAQDRYFDPGFQEAKQLQSEVTVLPGDDLVTECSYSTANRSHPTLGGHGVKEEACMAYILYYPRTALASCTSMTPVDFFFQTFGVEQFYNSDMEQVEEMLLNQSDRPRVAKVQRPPMQSLFFRFHEKQGFNIDHTKPYISIDGSDEEEGILSELIIDKPEEFQNKSFISHLRELPWPEKLFTQRVEEILNEGKFRTFCRLQDSTPAMPSGIYNFPNITEMNETRPISACRRERDSDFNFIETGLAPITLPTYSLLIFHVLFTFYILY